MIHLKTERKKDRKTERQKDRKTERQKGRLIAFWEIESFVEPMKQSVKKKKF